jgi:FAD/FMN-containing dehydrogenase
VVNGIPRQETAYVHRGMLTLLRPTTVWDDDAPASVGQGLDAWTRAMIAAIAPRTPNEGYQNVPNRAIGDWAEAYYAENLERLTEVKTRVDPDDMFRHEQSIPPRA